jgi:hypothetical protein
MVSPSLVRGTYHQRAWYGVQSLFPTVLELELPLGFCVGVRLPR